MMMRWKTCVGARGAFFLHHEPLLGVMAEIELEKPGQDSGVPNLADMVSIPYRT